MDIGEIQNEYDVVTVEELEGPGITMEEPEITPTSTEELPQTPEAEPTPAP